MASSALLQLGQNVERTECKNRDSVYLLLHKVSSPLPDLFCEHVQKCIQLCTGLLVCCSHFNEQILAMIALCSCVVVSLRPIWPVLAHNYTKKCFFNSFSCFSSSISMALSPHLKSFNLSSYFTILCNHHPPLLEAAGRL